MKDNVNLDNEKVYNSRFKMKLNRRDLRGMIFSAFPELSAAYDLKELYRRMNRDCSYDEAAALYEPFFMHLASIQRKTILINFAFKVKHELEGRDIELLSEALR